jgi:hypothetical protein
MNHLRLRQQVPARVFSLAVKDGKLLHAPSIPYDRKGEKKNVRRGLTLTWKRIDFEAGEIGSMRARTAKGRVSYERRSPCPAGSAAQIYRRRSARDRPDHSPRLSCGALDEAGLWPSQAGCRPTDSILLQSVAHRLPQCGGARPDPARHAPQLCLQHDRARPPSAARPRSHGPQDAQMFTRYNILDKDNRQAGADLLDGLLGPVDVKPGVKLAAVVGSRGRQSS